MMNRLMTWCIPDEALRWGRLSGWLTNDPFHYRVDYLLDRFWRQERERFEEIEAKYWNAQEPPPK